MNLNNVLAIYLRFIPKNPLYEDTLAILEGKDCMTLQIGISLLLVSARVAPYLIGMGATHLIDAYVKQDAT